MKTKEYILSILHSIDSNDRPLHWSFINALYMAVNNGVELNNHQESLLNTILGEISCGWRMNSDSPSMINNDVFTIATWINSCK